MTRVETACTSEIHR